VRKRGDAVGGDTDEVGSEDFSGLCKSDLWRILVDVPPGDGCPWDDPPMLQRIEIGAVLSGEARLHNLHWERSVELSLDCFVCERQGRTMLLEWGAERAVCTADKQHGRHYAAARIAAFDSTIEDQRLSLRAVVDYWWAPFHDAKRDVRGLPLTESPWVRLKFGYFCAQTEDSGNGSTQSNLVRPARTSCRHCGEAAATSTEAPTIRLLS